MSDKKMRARLIDALPFASEETAVDELRWAATHEALCRYWIQDILIALADVLEGKIERTGEHESS